MNLLGLNMLVFRIFLITSHPKLLRFLCERNYLKNIAMLEMTSLQRSIPRDHQSAWMADVSVSRFTQGFRGRWIFRRKSQSAIGLKEAFTNLDTTS
mmetsp:Transcript_50724/g.58160  ORF Transcript_50724/g.58160 Transcript_50724/m.58160 type:complete len:96 (-) Transcript_50724:2-289(-)